MDTWSLAAVAERLNTSVPRVQRAIERAGIVPLSDSRGRRLSLDQVECVRDILGFAPTVDGFTRHELWVLAALNARPLGLSSARAVARAASVSPTSASVALRNLIARGIVTLSSHRVIEGTVRESDVYEIDRRSPQWRQVAPQVRQVVTPSPRVRATRPIRIPSRLWHHFWNANPATIDVAVDEPYVAARLLRSGDPQAVAWAAANLSAAAISATASLRGVDEPERRLLARLAARAGAT